jgi:hypothetical protein
MRLLTVGFKLCSAGSRGVTAIKISGQSALFNKCLQTAYLSTANYDERSLPIAFVLPLLIAVTCGNGVNRIISTISAPPFYNPILRSNHKTNPATMAVHTKSSSQIISRSRALVVRYFPAHAASGGTYMRSALPFRARFRAATESGPRRRRGRPHVTKPPMLGREGLLDERY